MKQGNDVKKLNAVAVVTIAVCRTSKARNTKWITRPRLKQALVFFIFQKGNGWLQSISRFRRRGEKDKYNVNNALICVFHFDSGDMNVFLGQGKKTLKRNVVPTFEDLEKPVVEGKRKLPAARKSSRKLRSLRGNK